MRDASDSEASTVVALDVGQEPGAANKSHMRSWAALPLVVLALTLSACALDQGNGSGEGVASPTALSSYDLEDAELLRRLGSSLPEDIDWKRTIDGVEILGVGTRPDVSELDLMAGALAETPRALRAVVEPRSILRVPTVASYDPTHADARAFALGPDIYFIDETFLGDGQPPTRFDIARAYFHELAHVAQFMSLSPAYIDAALGGQVDSIDPSAGSTLVRDFAAATGWEDGSDDPIQPRWKLPAGRQASTSYGAVDPAEDMAEALAMVVGGRAEWIPADRAGWVEQWLGENADTLAAGKPWAPPDSAEVLSVQAVYDEAEVERLAARFTHIEPIYFQLSTSLSGHRILATTVETELSRRGFAGVLQRTDDQRLPRYAGLFQSTGPVVFWVELWDFREATGFSSGPTSPILTYVAFWD